jgi:hypothetical protein
MSLFERFWGAVLSLTLVAVSAFVLLLSLLGGVL